MDEQVLAAMKRWPDVPDVYGWLRLDRRGQWLLIDRNRPDFDEAVHGHGEPIRNTQICDFIARNYAVTEDGRWYWQNGPQRAFCELDLAPWICRVTRVGADGHQQLVTHTGLRCERLELVQLSDEGVLFVLTEHGPGAIHDLDLAELDVSFEDEAEAVTAADPATRPGSGRLRWNGEVLTIGPRDARTEGFVASPLRAAGR